MIQRLLGALAVASMALLPMAVHAQGTVCDAALLKAADAYQVGDFDRVRTLLRSCTTSAATYSDDRKRDDALALLASALLAQDSVTQAQTYVTQLLDANPDFQPRSDDLLAFRRMVEAVRGLARASSVSSVSKVEENQYEAPATVLLLTAEDLRARGYLDLEQLLHDLPGFDISRANGILYSNIYQRGYRSNNTNRMLLLVDGVEENDLWGNIAYLSRQYPMSNIESVEVVYGPASTMYGSNAFTGVISIRTRAPEAAFGESQNVAVQAEVTGGSWRTHSADATVSFRFPKHDVSLSVTGRYFRSDEADFGAAAGHDFAAFALDEGYPSSRYATTVRDHYYNRLQVRDSAAVAQLLSAPPGGSAYYEVERDTAGQPLAIVPTEAGIARALALDNALRTATDYADFTRTYASAVRLQVGAWQLGWQYWQKEEGVGVWFNEVRQATSNEGQLWSPTSSFFYIRHDKALTPRFTLTNFTRYKIHSYLDNNRLVGFNGYASGGLGLADLLTETPATWSSTALTTRSSQMRHETRAVYRHSDRLSVFGGVELRYSAIQDNYASGTASEGNANPGEHFYSTELGVFAQLRYQRNDLTLTGGLRLDYKDILGEVGYSVPLQGYAPQLNQRLAAVYHPGRYVFKAIYATAFKEATHFDKYSTVAGQRDISNPNLRPENAQNIEVSMRRFWSSSRRTGLEVVGYATYYSDIIASVRLSANGSFTNRFDNIGQRRVWGVQATSDYDWSWGNGHRVMAYGNYTFTLPLDRGDTLIATDGAILLDDGGLPITEVRVADMARHQVNAGLRYHWRDRFTLHFRTNVVGRRPTGAGTLVVNNHATFEPYAVCYGAASYTLPALGLTLQLVVNNAFDLDYHSPGVREADDQRFSSVLPQNPRNVHLRLRWSL